MSGSAPRIGAAGWHGIIPGLVLAVICPGLAAEIIHAGETVDLHGVRLADRPDLDGPITRVNGDGPLAHAFSAFADPGGRFSGVVEVSVHERAGTLAARYRVSEFSGAGYGIVGLSTQSQYDFFEPIEADYFSDLPGGVAPTAASWDGFGTAVSFAFGVPIQGGSDALSMFVVNDSNDIVVPLGFWGASVAVRDAAGTVTHAPFESYTAIIPAVPTVVPVVMGCVIGSRRRRAG